MRFRGFLTTAIACAFFLCACVGLRAYHISTFAHIRGAHTFYLDSPSSQALTKTTLSFSDLPRVNGESVVFSLQNQNPDTLVNEIAAQYRAQILFTERAGDTTSYYCYSRELGRGVMLCGVPVNLHIALSTERAAVGTPLIFGGF